MGQLVLAVVHLERRRNKQAGDTAVQEDFHYLCRLWQVYWDKFNYLNWIGILFIYLFTETSQAPE